VSAECPASVLKSAAAARLAEPDASFTTCMGFPQYRQGGGHQSVPVTEYPQQWYVITRACLGLSPSPVTGELGEEGCRIPRIRRRERT